MAKKRINITVETETLEQIKMAAAQQGMNLSFFIGWHMRMTLPRIIDSPAPVTPPRPARKRAK